MKIEIRYIKLGSGGEWEERCIERDNTIRLGYHSPHHQECLQGDWETLRKYWLGRRNGDQGAATRDVNQIKDFYELSESAIWVTFYKRKLHWCCTHKEIIEEGKEGERFRNVIGSWQCQDRNGQLLAIENIDGRITQVQGFRGTICTVKEPEYLLRKIAGEIQPDVASTQEAYDELKKSVQQLIKGLWWRDFELLVDLIFSKLGWQRVSLLGKTEKDIDLDIRSPITKKRACVQVKSSTSVEQIENSYNSLKGHDQYNEIYFVFHTLRGNQDDANIDASRFILWDASRIAELVIQAGLIDWLIQKRS